MPCTGSPIAAIVRSDSCAKHQPGKSLSRCARWRLAADTPRHRLLAKPITRPLFFLLFPLELASPFSFPTVHAVPAFRASGEKRAFVIFRLGRPACSLIVLFLYLPAVNRSGVANSQVFAAFVVLPQLLAVCGSGGSV